MIVVDETEPVGEIDPPFEPRDVQIRRGFNVRDYYDLEKEIGRGKFGTVYKCREKNTGLRLAAKFVQSSKKADRLNVEREVEIMKSLRHPRLIQLYDVFDDGKKEICLLLELIEGGELFERVIDDDFVLTERACAIFMRQICEGLEFMHQQNVLHLDMKPENILCLTRAGNRIKLIDFGLARRYDPTKKLQVLFGTPEFVAPEVVNFEAIGFGTDLWSIGIICYVLLSGLSPFMGETDVETMANVTIAKYDFEDEAFNDVSNDAKDFISKLLIKEISKRMTATECLRHPWLRRRSPLAIESKTTMTLPTSVPEAAKIRNSEQAKENTPPIVPSLPCTNNKADVLQLTKINLRQFVERWNSHPNSPFLYDSPRRTISLVSPNGIPCWPELSSRASLTGMSPSPPSSFSTPSMMGSLSSSPTKKHWDDPDSLFRHSTESPKWINNGPLDTGHGNDLVVVDRSKESDKTHIVSNLESIKPTKSGKFMTNVSECPKKGRLEELKTDLVNNNDGESYRNPSDNLVAESVESAIEKTTALLKSVRETLIRQIESGVSIRDRTGARVWERKGSGLGQTGSPSQVKGLFSQASFENKCDRNKLVKTTSIEHNPSNFFLNDKSTCPGHEDWEIHPPVSARTMGISKKHTTVNKVSKLTLVSPSTTNHETTSECTTSFISQDKSMALKMVNKNTSVKLNSQS